MKFDIIIQAGQSNSEGFGLGPVEKEYIPTEKVWQLDALKRATPLPDRMEVVYLDEPFVLKVAEECEGDSGKIGNFGLTFAEEYIKAGLLEEDRAILIIRAGVGGTGFCRKEWGLGSLLFLLKQKLYCHFVTVILLRSGIIFATLNSAKAEYHCRRQYICEAISLA